MSTILNDFPLRWSAGANILAFIPTIVGIMSNSIDEIVALADSSLTLSVVLSVSSVTVFNSRLLGSKSKDIPGILLSDHEANVCSTDIIISRLKHLTEKPQASKSWWRRTSVQLHTSCFVALIIAAGIWYQVYEITTYGVIVFACPIKANIPIWVALSQLLVLLNVFCRHVLFDIVTIPLGADFGIARGHFTTVPNSSNRRPYKIVLRSPRGTLMKSIMRTLTALTSFALYAYGTVMLASTTFIPVSDAIRAMAVITAGGGFGRLIDLAFATFWSKGDRVIIVDVPRGLVDEIRTEINVQFGQNHRGLSIKPRSKSIQISQAGVKDGATTLNGTDLADTNNTVMKVRRGNTW
ncbi:hypothetical protein ACLMJK_001099 [Lecanora helva]